VDEGLPSQGFTLYIVGVRIALQWFWRESSMAAGGKACLAFPFTSLLRVSARLRAAFGPGQT
jgi:hypothetical protein